MQMGDIIKQRRIELGLSQEELALRCGFKSKSTISKLESGQRTTKTANIEKVANALGLDPAKLIMPDTEDYVITTPEMDEIIEVMRKRPDISARLLSYAKFLQAAEEKKE